MLTAISPLDGRYQSRTASLGKYFSEFALIRYRVIVELRYFKALCQDARLPQLAGFPASAFAKFEEMETAFNEADAQRIKDIEKTTNHDVKAVEYFLKECFDQWGVGEWKEFIHFGLTSQDINNTAIPMSFKDALEKEYYPLMEQTIGQLEALANAWAEVPMLARTHGQSATPVRLGKELMVFVVRAKTQLAQLKSIAHSAKFGGATGGFNAHYAAYPNTDWHIFAEKFVTNLGLNRSFPTTQIEHYDNLAAQCHALVRLDNILIDFSRDVWTYVSLDYFKQKTIAGEVGSSAMPHKVNPIDFENAEGNLGMANAVLEFLAGKLPISRLQRDLTDSTVLRNLGVPMGHIAIALHSIQKGMSKLQLNEAKLRQDLEANWMVVAEAIQTVLRREAYPQPYEALKALTRGKVLVTEADIHGFIEALEVSEAIKAELKAFTPWGYS